jgi:polyisoprenoid-binding protein YceI
MKKTLLVTSLIAGMALSSIANAADYVIDTKGAHASVQFKIKHLGYSWLTGRFNDFSGDFSYDADKLSDSKISVKIDVSSIDSNHAERDKHLRGSKFLNVDENPISSFVSKRFVDNGDGSFDVVGDFTLNGVTREIVILSDKIGEGKDPWGGYRVGFTGTTSLLLKDYNVERDLGPASAEVYLTLDIEGIKK